MGDAAWSVFVAHPRLARRRIACSTRQFGPGYSSLSQGKRTLRFFPWPFVEPAPLWVGHRGPFRVYDSACQGQVISSQSSVPGAMGYTRALWLRGASTAYHSMVLNSL
ncbi:hypothetical protein PsYK624_120030 [Phanerochaete sordida]|uniref:Uncharacterized protein n=1 Tax=Phanerochaete sordida TaxID=48140 RepID=A0A9P3GJ01_9APHY|nr:hypothetical protein PsYK624_120030 [Phanerochaete sordida]